jgi:hypothetical protein
MAALAIFAAGDTLGHIGGQEGCQKSLEKKVLQKAMEDAKVRGC